MAFGSSNAQACPVASRKAEQNKKRWRTFDKPLISMLNPCETMVCYRKIACRPKSSRFEQASLRATIRQAGLTVEEFNALLENHSSRTGVEEVESSAQALAVYRHRVPDRTGLNPSTPWAEAISRGLYAAEYRNVSRSPAFASRRNNDPVRCVQPGIRRFLHHAEQEGQRAATNSRDATARTRGGAATR